MPLPPTVTIDEVFGNAPLAAALRRMGIANTEQAILLRERMFERISERDRLDAAALGQTQVLLATPLASSMRMARRKPAPGPCPLPAGVVADFVQLVSPILDVSRRVTQLEVWVRSRILLGLQTTCRSIEALLPRVEEAYADADISAAMRGVCFTPTEMAGMLAGWPPFPVPPLPEFLNLEEPLVGPLGASPLCSNFFNAAVQPAEPLTVRSLPAARITAFWPEIVPACPLPTAAVLRAYTDILNHNPKWVETEAYALGFFSTTLGTLLVTCGCLWGVVGLIGSGLRLGLWGLSRIAADCSMTPLERYRPPEPPRIFRAVHRYYTTLAKPELLIL